MKAASKVTCPICGKRDKLKKAPKAFVEVGEWHSISSKYDFECYVDEGYYCDRCNVTFWVYRGNVELGT